MNGATAISSTTIGSGGYTLSGAIDISSVLVVENDVNDPDASYVNNDVYDVAQSLPNSVSLGGYLNVVATDGDYFIAVYVAVGYSAYSFI